MLIYFRVFSLSLAHLSLSLSKTYSTSMLEKQKKNCWAAFQPVSINIRVLGFV